jgi:hypothetical protein
MYYAVSNYVIYVSDTSDAIRQPGAIFRFSLTDHFDPGFSFPNI